MFWKKPDAKKNEPEIAKAPDIGRNDPCPCGSGKKYKKCCIGKDETAQREAIQERWEKSASSAKEQADKKAKENPPTPGKSANTPKSAGQRHPTFIPHQVNMPRKSGGGG